MSSILESVENERSRDENHSPSEEDYRFLFKWLEDRARDEARALAHARAWELARQQGVRPIKSIRELQGDFWPEDESVDEFLDMVRRIRHQDDVSNRMSE